MTKFVSTSYKEINTYITDLAIVFQNHSDPQEEHCEPFFNEPQLALKILEILVSPPQNWEENENYYHASIFALDICISQLQIAQENGSKYSKKIITQLMEKIAELIYSCNYSSAFWSSILNIFYNTNIELIPELKHSYNELTLMELQFTNSININNAAAFISDLKQVSPFEATKKFFSESHPYPPSFFYNFTPDLLTSSTGIEIGVLSLLHPNQEIREIIINTFDNLITKITLTSSALRRLKIIKNWLPKTYQKKITRWINVQTNKNVIVDHRIPFKNYKIVASEIDGSSTQGILIHFKNNKQHKVCGILLKQNIGIKDAWVTTDIPCSEVKELFRKSTSNDVITREVNLDYLLQIINHFLALMKKQKTVPDLCLLEIQELLGCQFLPKTLDLTLLLAKISDCISPFDMDAMQSSFARSQLWEKNKLFVKYWYEENAEIDKIVNQFSVFTNGIRNCDLPQAMATVFTKALEKKRNKWLFHFSWLTLWYSAQKRKNEKMWIDSFFIAFAIYAKIPLIDIPIMHTICYQTVRNSLATMTTRKTHLN